MDTMILGSMAAGSIVAAMACAFIRHRKSVLQGNSFLGFAMRSMDITLADADAAGLHAEVEVAMRQCMVCSNNARCRRIWMNPLRSKAPEECPNLQLLGAIAGHRQLSKQEHPDPEPLSEFDAWVMQGCVTTRPTRHGR